LRTAMSLGRLYNAQGRIRDAYDLVSSVHARFAEGFETADLQSAKRILEEWTFDREPDALHQRIVLRDH
jgi:predicted ATPase